MNRRQLASPRPQCLQVGVRRSSPEVPPDVPPMLLSVLRSCLQPDPRDRPTAAAAVAQLQQAVAEGLRQAPPLPAVGLGV